MVNQYFGTKYLDTKAAVNLDSEHIYEQYKPLINSILKNNTFHNYGIQYEDLIQEIRIKLWKAFQHDIQSQKIAAYIRKVVNSVLVDHITDARKQFAILKHSEVVFSDFHSSEIEIIIMECVETLLESRRMVVTLYLRGFSVPDIAQILKWTKVKTYNLYIRGIIDLRTKLKDRGIHGEFKHKKRYFR